MTSVTTEVRGLHPSLAQALAAFPDPAAARAARALRLALRGRVAADGPAAWSSSRLTGDGFPVEFGFTTRDARLRYVAEPGGAGGDPRLRFEVVTELLGLLGSAPLPPDLAAGVRRMQGLGPLLYGAWLGGRHGTDGDEFKVYAEAPALDGFGPGRGVLPFEPPCPRLPDRTPELRMVACSAASGRWECYYRVRSLAPHHLPRVLAPGGAHERADEVLSTLTAAYGFPLAERLPGPSVGVSYSVPASGDGPPTVTLYFFARSLWGPDARIRRTFGRLGRAAGWDDAAYQQVTAPVADRQSWRTAHGLFGVSLIPGRPPAFGVGVRPWGADE
jgi:hypothetical protein